MDHVLVIAQGKGGVGKTSLAANIAGETAARGKRVLLIDLDQQGNLRRDLGTERDDGKALLMALSMGERLPVTPNVRAGLDLTPGGPYVADLSPLMHARAARGGPDLADSLRDGLTPLADQYDLIVVDTPPGDREVVVAAMSVARWLVIPTRTDDASIDGLELTAERFIQARERNPDLQLLGVVLFGVGGRATRIEQRVRADITELIGQAAPVLTSRVRYQEAAATDARSRGLLIYELAALAAEERHRRLRGLRGKQGGQGGGEAALATRDASALAGDYDALTTELLSLIDTHRVVAS